MIFSKAFITFSCIVLFSMIINEMDAYRLDQREVHTDNVNDNTDLTDPDFIQKLQKLIEAAAIVYTGNGNKDSAAEPDHEINTRLAANRRPGLIRLKKSE